MSTLFEGSFCSSLRPYGGRLEAGMVTGWLVQRVFHKNSDRAVSLVKGEKMRACLQIMNVVCVSGDSFWSLADFFRENPRRRCRRAFCVGLFVTHETLSSVATPVLINRST